MILRDYQHGAVAGVLDAFKANRSALIVMPTGCGKTVVFASIAKAIYEDSVTNGRTMVIAHRQELIWQARDKIEQVAQLRCDVEMGEYKSRVDGNDMFAPEAHVIVSTVQTHIAGGDGTGRMCKFNPMDFSLVIFDESHHAVTNSWRLIRDYYYANPNLKLLGVTATPDRSDQEALGQIFDTVAFEYDIHKAIRDGWLVYPDQAFCHVESLDFDNIRTTSGDLNSGDLDAIMKAEKPLHGVADGTLQQLGNRHGLGFAASVDHAKLLCSIFNRHRAGMCAVVSAKTDKDERKQILADFRSGRFQFIWNCGVFTEGADFPFVSLISIARPTKSRALYAQMIGRGTRPCEDIAHRLNNCPNPMLRRAMIARSGKPNCVILDFCGNSSRHKLISVADILGGNYSQEAIAAVNTSIRAGGRQPKRVDDMLEEEEKRIAEANKRRAEEARKSKLIGKAMVRYQKVDAFEILDVTPIAKREWHEGKTLTERQMKFLRDAKFDPLSMDYASACQLIGIITERREKKQCTVGQARILKRFGKDPNMSYDQAKKELDIISQGWKKQNQNRASAACESLD